MSDVNDYQELPASDRVLVEAITRDVIVPKTANEKRGVLMALATQYTKARAQDPRDPAKTEALGDLPLEAQFNLVHHRDQILDAELKINSKDMPAI